MLGPVEDTYGSARPVLWGGAADDRTGGDVEGSQQRRRAVLGEVVRAPLTLSRPPVNAAT